MVGLVHAFPNELHKPAMNLPERLTCGPQKLMLP